MKAYDFIIGYEHKQREIESICLLKVELERRGYKVLIYNTNDQRLKEHIKLYHAEVLLLPYAYDDKIISFSTRRAITFNKLINLQWEQAIYKQQEDNADSYRSPSGICRKAVHLSWGKANVDRLIQTVGLAPQKVRLVGNITLDFLKKPLSNFYLTKEEIYRKYSIPVDKKVCLFIASFKSALISDEDLDELCRLYGEWRREQHDVALRTMNTILDWIQKALDADPELYFIYRPHPGEQTYIVDEIQKRCERFVVIKDLSVKQWILIVDKIYTWISTTIAEVYFADKSCYILYPYELAEEATGRLFDNMDSIVDYETFVDSLKRSMPHFPITTEALDNYYLIDKGMSYRRIADVCEEVLDDAYYQIDEVELEKIYKMSIQGKTLVKKMNLYLWQLDWFYSLFWWLTDKLPLKGNYLEEKLSDRIKYEKWMKEEFVSEEDIHKTCDKIRECLEKDCREEQI